MPDCNVVLVIFVVFLITYIPASLHLFILPDYLPLQLHRAAHWSTWLYYIAFDASVLLIWINYYLSVRAPAGFVPSSYTPPTTLAPNTLLEIKQTTAKPRYCRSCSTYKPPRSHHCSTCNRCVLKMDHHCPWTNNCIGYYNQAHFVRFLLYVAVATSLCNAVCFAYLYALVVAPAYPLWYYNDHVFIRLVATCITLVLSGPVWLMVGGLACYHIYYVSTNCTTIESMEKDRKALVRRHDGRVGSVVNPYRLGVWANWASVFGETQPVWMWFLWSVPRGDGLTWQVNQEAEWEYVNAEVDREPEPHKMQAHVRRDSEEGYVVDMQKHPYGGYYKQIELRQQARAELDVVVVNRRRNEDEAGEADGEVWSDMSPSDRSDSDSSDTLSEEEDDEDNVPLFQHASVARRHSAAEAAAATQGGGGRGAKAQNGAGNHRQQGRGAKRRGGGGGWSKKKHV